MPIFSMQDTCFMLETREGEQKLLEMEREQETTP